MISALYEHIQSQVYVGTVKKQQTHKTPLCDCETRTSWTILRTEVCENCTGGGAEVCFTLQTSG